MMCSQVRLLPCLIALCLTFPHQARAGGIVYTTAQGPGNTTGESADSSGSGLNREEGTLVLLGSLTLTALVGLTQGLKRKEKVSSFEARYAQSARAMNKDLMRRKGRQYSWVVSRFLGLSRKRRRAFRCLLRQNQAELKGYLERALTRKKKHIGLLARQLMSYGELTGSKRTQCALLFRYLSGKAAFKRGLFSDVSNDDTRFINEYLELSYSATKHYHCLLRGRRSALIATLKMIDKPKTRYEGVSQLDQLLRDTSAQYKRGMRCTER